MTKIRKNEKYSKLLLSEGNETPVDEDNNYVMELPEWADEKKIRMGQKMFVLNANAMSHALLVGLMATASSPTLLKILMFTKQSSTEALAYRRYKANALHAQAWYRNPIKPGTRAWKSLETVRRMHAVVNRRSTKAGQGIISQKDMAITLFTFMGFHILCPKQFGIVGSREQFEAFNHLWRVLGYLMGTRDEFNCCGETLDETLSRLEAMRADIFVPQMQFPCEDYESYTRMAVEGMWHFDPTLHYDSLMWSMKRSLKVPGYYFFNSESNGDKKIYDELSTYTKFRIFTDILVYEFLTHIFIFRWIFNIARILFSVVDRTYPFLSLAKYGKKYAYVEIMKSKT